MTAAEASQLRPGDVVAGKYRVVRHLGSGAMGSVWAVTNELTERAFALKLVTPDSANEKEFRLRLAREARAAGRIDHKNVVEVYDVGETDAGTPFLVMQLLNGESLEARLARVGTLAPDAARRIAADVARALVAAHTAGIVHRDLKPANVFLHIDTDGTETVKVVDFGVSKVLASTEASASVTGLAIGSPAYMSPEQARGDRNVDHRSDLWALGVLLFEMLTGRRPFSGETAYDTVAEILKGHIPSVSESHPGIPPELDRIVAQCLTRDRDARPASAGEILKQLLPTADPDRHSLASLPVLPVALASAPDTSTVAPATRTHPGRDTARPPLRPLVLAAGALGGAAVFLALLVVVVLARRTSTAAEDPKLSATQPVGVLPAMPEVTPPAAVAPDAAAEVEAQPDLPDPPPTKPSPGTTTKKAPRPPVQPPKPSPTPAQPKLGLPSKGPG